MLRTAQHLWKPRFRLHTRFRGGFSHQDDHHHRRRLCSRPGRRGATVLLFDARA